MGGGFIIPLSVVLMSHKKTNKGNDLCNIALKVNGINRDSSINNFRK